MPDAQGFPDRPFPYVPGQAHLDWQWIDTPAGSPKVVAVIYDTGSTRAVGYWTEESFADLVKKMAAFLNGSGSLTVADLEDLRALGISALDKPGG